MVCDNCIKNKSIEVCGRCREITKYALVEMVLGLYETPEAILLKNQRNKTGSRSCKKPSIDALENSIKFYYNRGDSYRKIANYLGVSIGTVYNVIHGKRKNK
ncbi:helix-turn-helix domain containing protein [Clostridium beijerinckii]|uniref:helix-turn-helix domain containing protein n=1 Tax=Clostridium beijerinckii TaxID=1520 RepID=UPI00098BEF3E|nr:helix-turn-helix domain containing protein [Clostridium beijerinckii]NRT78653.1 hypothetical protein [Clostridium beijerinckii]OOM41377.1 hypothetical protein CBEIJ_44950 [Clostridium beijerinckii]